MGEGEVLAEVVGELVALLREAVVGEGGVVETVVVLYASILDRDGCEDTLMSNILRRVSVGRRQRCLESSGNIL